MPNTLPFLFIQCRPDGPLARDEVASIAKLGNLNPGTTLEPHLMLDEPDFDPAQLDLKRLYSGVIISGSPYSAGLDQNGHDAHGHSGQTSAKPSVSRGIAAPQSSDIVDAYSDVAFGSQVTEDLETPDLDLDVSSRPETPVEVAHLDRRVCSLVRKLLDEEIPTLGLCYGLHHLALGAGGVLTTQTSEDIQAVDITLTSEGREDPVTGQLDPVFSSYVGHLFSLEHLPKGATLLGTGLEARYQLVRFGKNAYGSQFHPEISTVGMQMRVDLYGGTYFQQDQYDLVAERVAAANVESSAQLVTAFIEYFQQNRRARANTDLTREYAFLGQESEVDLVSLHFAGNDQQLDNEKLDQSSYGIAQQDRFAYAF